MNQQDAGSCSSFKGENAVNTMMMLNHAEAISSEIERVRQRMNRLGGSHGLSHPEVMKCSQQLDELLIQHYVLQKRRGQQ